MADFSAKDVQSLRKTTGVGMMDAKQALTETSGDMDAAKDLLRERGLADAKKRAGRDANQGIVGYYLHSPSGYPTIGVLVELASETDFVAKNEEFQAMAHDIAMHVAAGQPRWVTRDEVPADAVAKEQELIARQAAAEGKPQEIIDRIVEGKISSFYEDYVLYDQTFINAEIFAGTIAEMVQGLAGRMGENISVRRFARVAVGEQED